MKKFFIVFLMFIFSTLYSQETVDRKIVFNDRIYDPFFAATIRDNEGEKFSVSRISFFDEYNDKKFFFWVRRNSGLYSMSFKNIKRISFAPGDFSDNRYIGFTRCTIDLVTGESFLSYLKTTGHMEGWDEVYSSPVTFYLHYNLIESIEFNHEGEYKLCTFCEMIYFDTDLTECIYDKTPLVEGVLSGSEK